VSPQLSVCLGMRDELKNFNWHVYGLSLTDFDYTLRLVGQIIEDRINQLPKRVEGSVGYNENGDKVTGEEIENEVLDDLAYYTWIDNFFVCQFGLWRLQGIFEGILKQQFFPDENLVGLKRKLDKVRQLKYSIADSDYNEILQWAQLRNALSHFPPEKYRPNGLNEQDIKQYADLAARVIMSLLEQKKQDRS
jgi:hypothetical protein